MARKKKHPLLQRIEYLLYRGVVGASKDMSPQALARWGSRLGWTAGHLLRSRDRLAMRNLRDTFPDRTDDALRQTLDAAWKHFGREALTYLQLQNRSLDEIAEACPFVNAHLLDEAIGRGRGVIVISAHFGGWEIAGLAIMALVKNVRSVARQLDNEYLERDLAAIRARTGAEVIDRRRAARALLQALNENGVVALLPDQAVLPREGILVPFLGRPAWTTPAPAKLALRLRSTIVFAFCIPDGTRHRLEFEHPIHCDELPEAEREAEKLTKRINDVISQRIIASPELWLWMHDRWKGTHGD